MTARLPLGKVRRMASDVGATWARELGKAVFAGSVQSQAQVDGYTADARAAFRDYRDKMLAAGYGLDVADMAHDACTAAFDQALARLEPALEIIRDRSAA